MSQENVELVKSITDPWARGDFDAVEWAHPEIEWEMADGPAPDTRRGVTGMLEGWREVLSAWEDWCGLLEGEPRELEGDRVLAFFRFTARGKASGLDAGELSTDGALLFELRDRKVVKLAHFWHRERALEAAGLSE